VSRRAFDVAYRRDPDQARSLLRFTAPSYLRGQALLVLESPDGISDTWLYQAEERRPRRVGTSHKADSFYGSDLSFEELEHQRFEHFALRRLPDAEEAGRTCVVIEAVPKRASQYARLVAWIDPARTALARIDFYRGASAEPAKRLRVALDGVVEEKGYLRVETMRIEQIGRDAFTDVVTERMEIDPAISEDVFSASFLEREGDDLFALVGRHPASGATPWSTRCVAARSTAPATRTRDRSCARLRPLATTPWCASAPAADVRSRCSAPARVVSWRSTAARVSSTRWS
jgi:hypothetical protein